MNRCVIQRYHFVTNLIANDSHEEEKFGVGEGRVESKENYLEE